MRKFDLSNWHKSSSRTMATEFTQRLTEMNTTNLPEGKVQPAFKAENVTPSVSRLFRKCGIADI
jgi:hypothetical protein